MEQADGEMLDAIDVETSDPLTGPTRNFGEEDFGNGGLLQHTDDAYRMVSPARPVFAPLQDADLADLTSAQVSAEVTMVSGRGTAGVTCAQDNNNAYIFGIGRNEDGETFAAIAYYDRTTGMPAPPDQSRPNDPSRPVDLPPPGEPTTVGAACQPGDNPAEALLTMTLNGETIISITANQSAPVGEVGLFAWGQGPEPLAATFKNFAAAGSVD